jgi:galactokinase
VWALGQAGQPMSGVDLLVDSTVPVGAGLSSSAALECSVGAALLALSGTELSEPVRDLLRDAAIRAESEVVGAPTGGMDQTVAMHARDGAALLIDFASGERTPVPLDLEGHTLLVTDTRVEHELTDGGYGARRADCEEAARLLGVPTLRTAELEAVARLADDRVRRRARHVVTEIQRVTDTVTALAERDWDGLGRLFDASHRSMRDDFEISCPELDCAVAIAVQAGAVAARMTGGGFGGSSVAVVPDERVEAVMRAVDAAFVLEGFGPPQHLRATPSSGASATAG